LATKITNNLSADLEKAIGNKESNNIFILTDDHTREYCLPKLLSVKALADSKVITIPSGDENKNINSAVKIWDFLSKNGATRSSLMINVGGGMITDIGGFTASTFKRGIDYINVSTTLLGAVDAATGGKTGINFDGLKNEVGVFAPAKEVLIDVNFFKTLDDKNLLSGYAEMVKHALIDNRDSWNEILSFDLETIDYNQLHVLLQKNIEIKERIVREDPKEKGLRKALNLGHTFGHAFESLSYKTDHPALHGYAVIWGLLCELYLSHIKLDFPKEEILRLRDMIKEYYGFFAFSCKEYEALYELMTHDKKNDSNKINFTLLSNVGDVHINQTASKDEIYECFDYLREG
jgi:3-dehydroquinate synthase